MVTEKRWQEAQAYEQSYWARLADNIALGSTGQLGWYSWKADLMEQHLVSIADELSLREGKILEIGSGPIGIATFMKWGERYTLDPLEDFYRSNSRLSELRNRSVTYGVGSGEKVPFGDETFSLVILDNVLDHVHGAGQVLDEIHRVLSKGRFLYLAVNIHIPWGAFLHRILSRLKIDRGHPYTFTDRSIRKFVTDHKFVIRKEFINDYAEAKEKDMKSSSLKDQIKGRTGLSEFVYYAVCQKVS
ncbi:MAG TPA: class I SAM-dependent methyltransferase [Nitrospiraceae bacterium]|nr:class I SAM-dependent methyltransferase [Nitrospiraceae bacterium]